MPTNNRDKSYIYSKLSAALLFLVFLVSMLTAFSYYIIFYKAVIVPDSKIVRVESGQDFSKILDSIGQDIPLEYPSILSIYARLTGISRKVHVGEYEFEGDLTWNKILMALAEGKVKERQFTIVEGWNIYTLIDKLEKDKFLTKKLHYGNYDKTKIQMPSIMGSPEGAYLPNTYSFTYPDSDLDVLKRANDAMLAKLSSLNGCKFANKYDLLVIASLLEKEAIGNEEMSLVAGVVSNRLKKNMSLDIDASVRYGVKNFSSPLLKSELRNKNKYNLYLNKGLPPTPIANPSVIALNSACSPTKSSYYFYVVEDEGKHYFSKTLSEHRKAVKRYRAAKQKIDKFTK